MTAQLVVPHPVLAAVDAVETALLAAGDAQPVFMTTGEKQDALRRLARAEAQAAELRLRILAASDEVGQGSGARDAGAWVSVETRTDSGVARADLRLARALESRPLVAEGMRAGEVSVAQARVIVAGIEALPAELGPELASEAEATLVGYASSYRPGELRRLARRILDVVAPDIAEEEAGKRLEDEERRARERESLRHRDNPDGTSDIWWRCPTAVRKRLWTYLDAMTSPRREATRPGADAEPKGRAAGERVPWTRARAAALAALLENLDPDGLPQHGGDATTILVTMTLDQLRTELATAAVIDGDGESEISAAEARRMACQASILPMVLGGRSEILDLGRRSRLFRAPQRRVVRMRDRHCRAEGCDIPAAWCEVHHRQPWAQGGATDLANGACLCSRHHHVIHDPKYGHEWLPNGDVRFHRQR